MLNTDSSHPALQKFIASGGIVPIYEICLEIRDKKKFTMGEQRDLDLYRCDLDVFKGLVKCLKNLPIKAKVLTETRIGRGVNSIVKDGIFKSEPINQIALDLVNNWKALVQSKKNKSDSSSAKNPILSESAEVVINDCSQNSNLTEDDDQALNMINEALKSTSAL